jgi:hypothetical protein
MYELNDEVERLRRQLQYKEDELKRKQTNCKHNFTEPVYDPDKKQEGTYSHLEGCGSDPYPVYNYREVDVPRWSKTCKECGLKKYTFKRKPVQYEPDFD